MQRDVARHPHVACPDGFPVPVFHPPLDTQLPVGDTPVAQAIASTQAEPVQRALPASPWRRIQRERKLARVDHPAIVHAQRKRLLEPTARLQRQFASERRLPAQTRLQDELCRRRLPGEARFAGEGKRERGSRVGKLDSASADFCFATEHSDASRRRAELHFGLQAQRAACRSRRQRYAQAARQLNEQWQRHLGDEPCRLLVGLTTDAQPRVRPRPDGRQPLHMKFRRIARSLRRGGTRRQPQQVAVGTEFRLQLPLALAQEEAAMDVELRTR